FRSRPIRPLKDLIVLLQLFLFLREEAPDIVHTHSSKGGILGRLAARLAGVRFIIHTYHGFGFHTGQNPVLRSLYRLMERIASKLTTRIIFVSQANEKTARALGLVREGQGVLRRSRAGARGYPARKCVRSVTTAPPRRARVTS